MSAPVTDPVNHPAHYTQGSVECIDAIESALGPQGFIAWLRGTVIKYQWRLGRKDAPAQDAAKANWYGIRLEAALSDPVYAVAARPDDAQAQPVPRHGPGALGLSALALLRRFEKLQAQNALAVNDFADLAEEARLLLGMVELRDNG